MQKALSFFEIIQTFDYLITSQIDIRSTSLSVVCVSLFENSSARFISLFYQLKFVVIWQNFPKNDQKITTHEAFNLKSR